MTEMDHRPTLAEVTREAEANQSGVVLNQGQVRLPEGLPMVPNRPLIIDYKGNLAR